MNDYETGDERRALEADFDRLPAETTTAEDVSTVVSVRLRGDELAAVEHAANAANMPLSTFIRHAALGSEPHARLMTLDLRAASARAEVIQTEALKLIALLHGEVA